MSSNKRHSMLPAVSNQGPRPPVSFSSSFTVADSAILVGTHSITIQSESVLHPRSKLETTNGSILIGRRCIIHERAHIGKVGNDDASGGISLGDYVTVEVGATIESGGTDIGTDTVVGVRSRIGHGAVIGKNCTISPLTIIKPGEKVPDFTVVYSNGQRRTDRRGVADLRHKAQARQIDVLRRLIPNKAEKWLS
ncbi:transferase hexapeptide domain-containing protein [Colletotrichum paranaense]|uniref:Dynactin subunit 6 n=1 Tax=Colletotrichum paranaense TaxID=1914294 RepID=A0ABQ9S6N7_9PEZI|nr:transferase hexapeptide domain-containing protein [Colletotrichum paranaense]KAK1527971.1 transferase hexapeptide domain-containing protein [Colletotrichum paranaense]